MKHESRLLWVLIEDLPKLIAAKITFSCGAPAMDDLFVVTQLYNNEAIKELDGMDVDWVYPTPTGMKRSV